MSTSLRIDTSELISGALVIGDTGGGVLGSSVPSSGTNGAGYAYNDLAPGDLTKEVMGRVLTQPSAGTLTTFEDTSFIFEGAPDGTYNFTYQLYVDYVAIGGPTTVTLNVGNNMLTSLTCTSALTSNLTTAIRFNFNASSESVITANLTTGIGLDSQLFSVSSISAQLSQNTTDLSANLFGSVSISPSLSTEISLSSVLSSVANLQANLLANNTGPIKAGDKLTMTLINQNYTITLL